MINKQIYFTDLAYAEWLKSSPGQEFSAATNRVMRGWCSLWDWISLVVRFTEATQIRLVIYRILSIFIDLEQ